MSAKNKNLKTPATRNKGFLFNVFFFFLVVILPLVFFQTAQDASLLPRMMVLSLFLLGYSGYIYVFHRETIINLDLLKNPVLILGALYLFMSVISLVPALNRSEGLFDITKTGLTLLVVVYAAQLFSVTPGWFARLSNLAVIAASIAILIGFYQFFTQVPGHQAEHLANGRDIINVVKGLMGNKNEYASYLMLLVPFTIYAAVSGKGNWRLSGVAATILLFVMLALVATRAAWVGLFIAGFAATVIAIVNYKKLEISARQVKTIVIITSSVVIVLAAGILEGGKYTHSKYMEKLGSIVRPEADNNHFRLGMWKITARMAMDNPVAGVGAGNWQIAIPEYYSRIGLRDKDVNWISPHNDYLWILSEKGFIGLALYLGMLLAAAWLLLRIFRGQADKSAKWQAVFLCAGLIGYLAVAFFDFPYQRIDHQVMFAVIIGGLVALFQESRAGKPANVNRHMLLVPVMLFLVLSAVYGFQALKVETHVKKAIALQKAGDMTGALNEITVAHTTWRNLDAAGSPVDYYAGMIYASMNDHHAAIVAYRSALADHPNHIALLNNLGKSYYATGYFGSAEHYYRKALEIVPGYKEARVNLSTLYYVRGDFKQSYEMLRGIRGGSRMPEIKQNRRALEKLLGFPADSLKVKKHHHKTGKKDKKNRTGV
ncbi:MAG: O-antigen ligase family protein [Bacteroidetes bacterium]|nr:O-antigen ligase family protein [Bacteroidota bacterium]